MRGNSGTVRVDWVDYAKGFCIILVVMMHSTIGVGKAIGDQGWMGEIVAFAKPFRMPDFFMISGLFLAQTIKRDWRLYLDRKAVHFFYFYILWLNIQFAIKAPSFAGEFGWNGVLEAYLLAYVQPFGTLWFIYVLPIFFVISKVLHDLKVPWQVTWVAGALLHMSQLNTGSVLIDESASRFVFFFSGYIFAGNIFSLASWVRANKLLGLLYMALWAVMNGALVKLSYSEVPLLSLLLGGFGALAVITVSALLSDVHRLDFLRHFGQNSIVIYLSFFFPMAVTRVILLKLGVLQDPGVISLIVTAVATLSPVVLWWLIQKLNFGRFLFIRPRWAHIASKATGKPADKAGVA